MIAEILVKKIMRSKNHFSKSQM